MYLGREKKTYSSVCVIKLIYVKYIATDQVHIVCLSTSFDVHYLRNIIA